MVHKANPYRSIMEGAPWRIFRKDDVEVLIDVEGGITINGHTAKPFPCEITHATLCDSGIVATWVDHELRLARMALLPLDKELKDGPSKAELRINRDLMVSGAEWCHIVDAEPLAVKSNGEIIVFALWARGIYCIDSSANEIWRLPLFADEGKALPRSNEVSSITISGDDIIVWLRGGTYRRISMSEGEVLTEKSIGVECDLENVFSSGDKHLLTSKDGWAWELVDGAITLARKFIGTIQDAVHDGSDWRIISWREDTLLRGESQTRDELGVQIIKNDDSTWMVLDNQGNITPHLNE